MSLHKTDVPNCEINSIGLLQKDITFCNMLSSAPSAPNSIGSSCLDSAVPFEELNILRVCSAASASVIASLRVFGRCENISYLTFLPQFIFGTLE